MFPLTYISTLNLEVVAHSLNNQPTNGLYWDERKLSEQSKHNNVRNQRSWNKILTSLESNTIKIVVGKMELQSVLVLLLCPNNLHYPRIPN